MRCTALEWNRRYSCRKSITHLHHTCLAADEFLVPTATFRLADDAPGRCHSTPAAWNFQALLCHHGGRENVIESCQPELSRCMIGLLRLLWAPRCVQREPVAPTSLEVTHTPQGSPQSRPEALLRSNPADSIDSHHPPHPHPHPISSQPPPIIPPHTSTPTSNTNTTHHRHHPIPQQKSNNNSNNRSTTP